MNVEKFGNFAYVRIFVLQLKFAQRWDESHHWLYHATPYQRRNGKDPGQKRGKVG